MRLAMITSLILAGLAGQPAVAEGERAGNFDYYVLALSWSPTWCATDGRDRNAPQCQRNLRTGFVVHGLWPQNEEGWPSYCRTGARDPSRSQSAGMVDIMGTDGAAWYQWKKHGRCSGLNAPDYYATMRVAFSAVQIPDVFRKLDRDVKLPASVVEEAFVEVNPGMTPDGITVTCDDDRIDEVRICLTKDLRPRTCAPDTRRDCRMRDALMAHPR